MEQKFKCPICGNEDPKKIGIRNGQKYCRACLSFIGEKAPLAPHTTKSAYFHLDYELSDEQHKISEELLDNYIKGKDTLLKAVTGAGKTELVFKVIRYAIEHGGKVGFAIPRKDVVVELYERLHSTFKENKVVAVYGGNSKTLDGDLICLTTHQLYRYPNVFDLLIVDEIDAFPYKGNKVLEAMVKNSIRGHLIMMSATPDDNVINNFKKEGRTILSLNARYHGYPLPVPEVVKRISFSKTYALIQYLKQFKLEHKQVFVFTPTIDVCEATYKMVSIFVKGGNYVHSKHPKRDKIIRDFKDRKYDYLITTAVLERGVTVKNLQVIVFMADHKLYDEYALVQISGRAGRKIDAPTGKVIFLVDKENEQIKRCIETIKESNRDLQSLL